MNSLLYFLVGVQCLLCGCDAADLNYSPTVETQQGPVRGLVAESLMSGRQYYAFLGVPYAKQPVGELRFQAPQPPEKWDGLLDATTQVECLRYYAPAKKVFGQESCLELNVYTPDLKGNLPVMVFIHGGAFMSGSSLRSVHGADLLMKKDVVLVTINYRIGVLGFLSTGDTVVPGNNGLKDQVMAFRWVQNNIASFGGDPDCVTIFGESAGGAGVALHMMSPLNEGLFHRAIAQSGYPRVMWRDEQVQKEKARRVAEHFKCPTGNSKEIVDCLRKSDTPEMFPVVGNEFYMWNNLPLSPYGPVIEPQWEGAFLTQSPWQAWSTDGYLHDVPYISGFNRNEGSVYAIGILENEDRLRELSKNWEEYAPVLYNYMGLETVNKTDINRKIREFYFRNDQLGLHNGKELIDSIGDRIYIQPVYKSTKLHSSLAGKGPVYVYELSYRGPNSALNIFAKEFAANKSLDYGVTHFDDMQYMLNCEWMPHPFRENTPDSAFANTVLTLWTNFAKTGNPTPEDQKETLGFEWLPAEPKKYQYLELNWPPAMRSEYDMPLSRMNFWDQLTLPDRPPEYPNTMTYTNKDEL